MTTETTWRDEFDVVLKTIVLPGEFDILDATDRSRWLGALQQSYDAGRNKAEQYKEDAERYRWLREQEGWPESEAAMSGISPIDFDSVIDKARKS